MTKSMTIPRVRPLTHVRLAPRIYLRVVTHQRASLARIIGLCTGDLATCEAVHVHRIADSRLVETLLI